MAGSFRRSALPGAVKSSSGTSRFVQSSCCSSPRLRVERPSGPEAFMPGPSSTSMNQVRKSPATALRRMALVSPSWLNTRSNSPSSTSGSPLRVQPRYVELVGVAGAHLLGAQGVAVQVHKFREHLAPG